MHGPGVPGRRGGESWQGRGAGKSTRVLCRRYFSQGQGAGIFRQSKPGLNQSYLGC